MTHPIQTDVTLPHPVLNVLGGPRHVDQILSTMEREFWCIACGNSGHADVATPAAVIGLRETARSGVDDLILVHSGCVSSHVITVDGFAYDADPLLLLGTPHLRPAGRDPRAVLLLRSRRSTPSPAGPEAVADILTDCGFSPLTRPDQPLPDDEFDAILSGDRLTITDVTAQVFYDAVLPLPDGWATAALDASRIGIIHAHDLGARPDADQQEEDLIDTIRRGEALAATALLDPPDTSG